MKLTAYTKPLLTILAIATVSCTVESIDDTDVKRSESEVIIENLELAGYPRSEIGVLPDGTVFVGGDAVVTLQASREMAGIVDDVEHADGFRGYRTTNMVDTTRISTICIDSSNPNGNAPSYDQENGLMSQALDNAIANYNSQNLQFTMVRNGNNCDATISAYIDSSGGGVAGFPSGGDPYHEFYAGQDLASDYGVPVATHVITHELGHCVGFRHTDYYNRSISCGGAATNEGAAGVGAILIPGTSDEAVMNGSVMNACFNQGSTGNWTGDDVTALDCLYDSGACAPPPPPSYSIIDQRTNQSANAAVETQYGPYDASGYDAFRVSMSGGSGDADLYVRFGAPPTTGAYDCRPYLNGNNESCEFNPSQSGNYYVMVRAYQAYSGVTLTVEGAGGGNPPPPPPAEVCDDGVDNDQDDQTDCDDSDCSGDDACQPQPEPEVCDDGVDNDLDDQTDCDDSDCSGDAACEEPPPPVGWQELFSDDFNSGWGNWNDGGSDVRRSGNDSAYGNDGTTPVRLRDNSGEVSAMSSDSFDLSGWSQLKIDFSFYPRSMENGEDFFVELYDGGSWVEIGQRAAGSDFVNNTRYSDSFEVNSGQVNFSGNAQLRIRCDASGNSDWIYVDDVVVLVQ